MDAEDVDRLEVTVGSYGEFNDVIERVDRIKPYPVGVPGGPVLDSRYVWRGQGCHDWGLHSKIARSYRDLNGRYGSEDELLTMEELIWREALEWDLDWHSGGGRLSYRELLAKLQHHGAPTRLIDVTASPHVALWFAVQEKKHLDDDARVFAVDVSQCQDLPRRSAPEPEWPWSTGAEGADAVRFTVWRPPPLDARIDRQLGAFLVGPVPGDEGEREFQSLNIGFSDYNFVVGDGVRKGQPPAHIVIRIPKEAKSNIKKSLERLHGLSASRLFPDAAGFADLAERSQKKNPYPGVRPGVTVHQQEDYVDPGDAAVVERVVARLSEFSAPAGSFRVLWRKYFPVVEIDSRRTSLAFGDVQRVCAAEVPPGVKLSVRERTWADLPSQS